MRLIVILSLVPVLTAVFVFRRVHRLIVIFLRGEALAILGMAAVATMVAAAIPSGWRGADPAD